MLVQYGLGGVLWAAAFVVAAQPAVTPADGTPDQPPPSMFTFGGFGTLGVVHSDQPLADFTASPFESAGAGHTRAWSPAVDSLIAAQVSAAFTSRLSAVLQVMSEQNADSSFTPHVEWANIKYQFSPDFSVRVGRTALGVFLVNDLRDVGFAYPWVRPPVEVYNLVPITNNDGIGFSYRFPAAGGSNTIDGSVGHAHYDYAIPNSHATGTAGATEQLTLVDTYQRGSATLRLTYGQAHLTIPTFAPLFDAFREFGPQGIGIADRYDVDDRLIDFYGLSASYEPGDWFAMAEWGRVDTHSVLGETTGWYVSSGYRFGAITPYATYAQVRPNTSAQDPGLDLSALPPYLTAPAAALNSGLNASLGTIASQRTLSLGARFDVRRNVDLKLQWDRINLGANSQGWLTNLQPGFRPGSSLTVITLNLDFVF
jgi:hypothetical protein